MVATGALKNCQRCGQGVFFPDMGGDPYCVICGHYPWVKVPESLRKDAQVRRPQDSDSLRSVDLSVDMRGRPRGRRPHHPRPPRPDKVLRLRLWYIQGVEKRRGVDGITVGHEVAYVCDIETLSDSPNWWFMAEMPRLSAPIKAAFEAAVRVRLLHIRAWIKDARREGAADRNTTPMRERKLRIKG